MPQASSPGLIVVDQVHKIFQMGDVEVQALAGVSLSVMQGEFVTIMGASGSGKSTLMNILGCLDRPTRGRYLLEGQDVSELGPTGMAELRNRMLAFIFQSYNLLGRTSALENVELPLIYSGVPKAERHSRSHEALSRVGLADRMHHFPNQLSGGQQQRVAIARALASRPRVILADEPTGNLDSKTGTQVLELFGQVCQEDGITVLLVTHDPSVSLYARRRISMKDGEIESDQVVKEGRFGAAGTKQGATWA